MYGRESVELFLLAIDVAMPVVFDDGDSYVAHACPLLTVFPFRTLWRAYRSGNGACSVLRFGGQ